MVRFLLIKVIPKVTFFLGIIFNFNVSVAQEFIESSEIIDGKLVRSYLFQRSSSNRVESDVFTATIPLLPGDVPELKCKLEYNQQITVTVPNSTSGGVYTTVAAIILYQNFQDQQFLICDTSNVKNYNYFPDVLDYQFSDSGIIEDNDKDNGRGVVIEEGSAGLRVEIFSGVYSVPSGSTVTNSADFTFTMELIYDDVPDDMDVALDSSLKLAQNVFDPDISSNPDPTEDDGIVDIVADRLLDIQILGSVEGIDTGSLIEADIFIEDLINGTEAYYQTVTIPVEGKIFKKYLPLPSNAEGLFQIRVEVDPQDAYENEISETNNISYSKKFKVIRSNPLPIGIIKIDAPTLCAEIPCYSPIDNIDLLSILDPLNAQNINDLFPVAQGEATVDQLNPGFTGNPIRSLDSDGVSAGFLADIRSLMRRRYPFRKRKIFGAVNTNYFPYHEILPDIPKAIVEGAVVEDSSGTAQVGFISRGGPQVFLHELGHTFGAFHFNGPVDGYVNKTAFEIQPNTPSIMAERYTSGSPLPWIDVNSYEYALFALTNPAIDPEILVVSGFLNANSGEISDLTIEEFPEGNLSEQLSFFEYSVEAKDFNGNIISSAPFSSSLNLLFDSVNSEGVRSEKKVPFSTIPFAVSLPMSDEIFSVTVSKGDQVVSEVTVKEKLFASDIVDDLMLSDIKGRWFFFKLVKYWKIIYLAKKIDRLVERGKIKRAKKLLKYLMKLTTRSVKNGEKKESILQRLGQMSSLLDLMYN